MFTEAFCPIITRMTSVEFIEPSLIQYIETEVHTNKKRLPYNDNLLWEHTGSNRGPSACKADALNQLSYAPNCKNCFRISMCFNRFGSAKIHGEIYSPNFF